MLFQRFQPNGLYNAFEVFAYRLISIMLERNIWLFKVFFFL